MVTEAQSGGVGMFADRGFALQQLGCEVVLLLHEGELVARFSQTGATEQSIQAACAKHLAVKHGWDGTLWQSP